MLPRLTPQSNGGAQSEFDKGFAFYMRGGKLSNCPTPEAAAGWRSAAKAEMACNVVDAVFAMGGNATQADVALLAESRSWK